MSKTRLEAFSDGVIAILITIMVLELRTPHGTTWAALREDLPVLLAYVLSFVLIGIYWNNHHHMLAAVTRISGMTLWANQHLLFWLSLIPVATAWMSENHFPPIPVAAYGVVLLAASLAYSVLQATLGLAQRSDDLANSFAVRAVKRSIREPDPCGLPTNASPIRLGRWEVAGRYTTSTPQVRGCRPLDCSPCQESQAVKPQVLGRRSFARHHTAASGRLRGSKAPEAR